MEAEKEWCEELHEDGVEEKNPCAGPHVPQCIPSISLRISVTLVEIDLSHKLPNTGDNDCKDEAIQWDHEIEEGRIVVLADAGSQPDAMMVKLTDTIITDVAVGGLRRAKD